MLTLQELNELINEEFTQTEYDALFYKKTIVFNPIKNKYVQFVSYDDAEWFKNECGGRLFKYNILVEDLQIRTLEELNSLLSIRFTEDAYKSLLKNKTIIYDKTNNRFVPFNSYTDASWYAKEYGGILFDNSCLYKPICVSTRIKTSI